MTLYEVRYYKNEKLIETDIVISDSKVNAILISVDLSKNDSSFIFEDIDNIQANMLCLLEEIIAQKDLKINKTIL